MDNGSSNEGADRDQWFELLLDAYNTAAKFMQDVRVIQSWLLELRFRATLYDVLTAAEQLPSAYDASWAVDRVATVLCDNLKRAMGPRTFVAVFSTDLLPKTVEACVTHRKALVSATGNLRAASPDAISAWKAHLTAKLEEAGGFTLDLRGPAQASSGSD